MPELKPKFITDSQGNKVSVVLSMKEFKWLIDKLEDLEDIRLYDEAKKSKEPSIPIDEAFRLIESNRKSKKWLTV